MKRPPKNDAEAPRRATAASVATIARVDLLPPIVEVRRKQNATLRLLSLSLGGLLLITVTGGFAMTLLSGSAEQALVDEQARGTQLLAEQQKYTEVAGVKAQLIDYDAIIYSALFAETDWARLMRELDGALPAGMELTSESVTLKGLSADAAAAAPPAAPLDAPGLIEIAFTASAPAFESSTPLLNGLAALTGYASASVSAVSSAGDDGYVITGVVQLSSTALGGTARVGELDAAQLEQLRLALETAVIAPPEPPAAPENTDAAAATTIEE